MTRRMDGQSRMHHRVPVLLLEGDRSEVPAVSKALDDLGMNYGVLYVSRAEEALTFLRENTSRKPTIILFERADRETVGLKVLRRLKADDGLRSIPVIFLASSSDVETINESFGLGVAGYIVKSPDSQEFAEAMRAIDRYWTLSQVPQKD